MQKTLEEHALEAANHGFPVFRLRPRSKVPMAEGWQVEATQDSEAIKGLWKKAPRANIGVITGNGLIVVDVDVDQQKGIDGTPSFIQLKKEFSLPDTANLVTGRGGTHYYYRVPSEVAVKNRTGLCDGIDIRGDGGYVVADGSIHENGNKYFWDQSPSEITISELPKAFIEFIGKEKSANLRTIKSSSLDIDLSTVLFGVPESKRNHLLFRYGCRLRAQGLRAPEIEVLLTKAAENSLPPFPLDELKKVVESVGRYKKTDAQLHSSIALIEETFSQLDKHDNDEWIEVFNPECLKAMEIISHRDPLEWQKIRSVLKNHKINLPDLKKAIKNLTREKILSTQKQNFNKTGEQNAYGYLTHEGCLQMKRTDKDGIEFIVPLTNFTAEIISEINLVNDHTPQKLYELKGAIRNSHPVSNVLVRVEEFKTLDWVENHWGHKAIIIPGYSKEHAATAIRVLSGNVESRNIYAKTGFIVEKDVRYFLDSHKAISVEGINNAIAVETERNLKKVDLWGEVVCRNDLTTCIAKSLDLVNVCEETVSFPLLAFTLISPLAQIAGIDFSIFVTGKTGSYKSELTAIMQSFWGSEFDSRSFPLNWSSTSNFILMLLFYGKEVLLTIDDFAPKDNLSESQRLHTKAGDVFRSVGNKDGRQRLTADSKSQPTLFPRAAVISCGEDLPKGHSIKARLLILELKPESVNLDKLTEAQAQRSEGVYVKVTTSFIRWLLKQDFTNIKAHIIERKNRIRENVEANGHPRNLEAMCLLISCFEVFADFVKQESDFSSDTLNFLTRKLTPILLGLLPNQEAYQKSEDHCVKFLSLIMDALRSGKAHLCSPTTGLEPTYYASSAGWLKDPFSERMKPSGQKIGWLSSAEVMLIQETAYGLVESMSREQGATFGITQQTLWKRLSERGIITKADEGKHTVKRKLEGESHRVLVFNPNSLFPPDDSILELATLKKEETQHALEIK